MPSTVAEGSEITAQCTPLRAEFRVDFRYSVHFTRAAFALRNPLLRDVLAPRESRLRSKALVVVDDGVARHHPRLLDSIDAYCRHHADAIEIVAPPLVVTGGEAAKDGEADVERVRSAIERRGICRHSFVVAVGGGAALDTVGFAAATAHRGVRLVRMPTTVLAQNDSGVGVKNAVNAYGKKNFVGTFAPPYAVVNDFDFLVSLSDRDWRSGISEAVKVAVLKDEAFFAFIEEHADALVRRDIAPMEHLVHRCAELHLDHIANYGDPFELGSARPLDFGHWAAHKLERLSDHRLRHGEAVAIGIALDTTYAYLAGRIGRVEWERIVGVLEAVRLPIHAPELASDGDDCARLLDGLDEFREHLGGRLTITLPDRIGGASEVHRIDEELVRRSIAVLAKRASVRKEGELTCMTA